jgi:hypothetical protein
MSGASKEWATHGSIMLGPYLLTAFGCWRSPHRLPRILAIIAVVGGMIITSGAITEARSILRGEPVPAYGAAFGGAMVMVIQYPLAIIATIYGIAGGDDDD